HIAVREVRDAVHEKIPAAEHALFREIHDQVAARVPAPETYEAHLSIAADDGHAIVDRDGWRRRLQLFERVRERGLHAQLLLEARLRGRVLFRGSAGLHVVELLWQRSTKVAEQAGMHVIGRAHFRARELVAD